MTGFELHVNEESTPLRLIPSLVNRSTQVHFGNSNKLASRDFHGIVGQTDLTQCFEPSSHKGRATWPETLF
jgi:hypothetical protein